MRRRRGAEQKRSDPAGKPARQFLSLPKGHIDEEEPLTVARREIREESGVTDLKLIKELGSYERYKGGLDGGDDPSEFKTIHMFLFSTDQEKLQPLDPCNPEARWVDRKSRRTADLRKR